MKPVATSRFLGTAQTGAKTDIQALFKSASVQLGVLVRSNAINGRIPDSAKDAVLEAAGAIILNMFVAPGTRRAFAADGVTALAPFPRILNKWYVFTVTKIGRAHHDWMQDHMPADVFRWLEGRNLSSSRLIQEEENPFLRGENETPEAYRARLDDLRIFRVNPLAEYEPMHTWVDPNGYRLSDRIWNTADATRRQIDQMVREAINTGMSAERLARQLEQFLVPGRAQLRTRRPYGRDASADAMRLARTELSRAHAQAAYISAYMNPYVGGIDWALSPSHPKSDVCDSYATIGMGGGRLRPAYAMSAARLPPAHPHCLCRVQTAMLDTPQTVTTRLRAAMEDARGDAIRAGVTPIQLSAFLEQILGPLNQLVGQVA